MPSDEYFQNILPSPGVERVTVAEVIYSLVAPQAKEGGILDLPPGNEFSRRDQVLNGVQHIEYPIATLEPKHWKLDGTFVMPLPPEKSNIEIGWWSDIMSDENGILNPPQIVTREFDNVQAFTSLGIAFDKATNNYCTDFEAYFYNTAGQITHHEHITDNTSYYGRTLEAGFNIIKVVIILHKTHKPFRYARVAELDFGVYLKFDEYDIKSIAAINETDYLGKNFILPEFSLSILNKGRFDQLDKNSFAPFMQTRQKFEYRHGLILPNKWNYKLDGSWKLGESPFISTERVEFVDCGSYILKNWSVSDSIVSFTATGINSELENIIFFDSSFEELTVTQFVKKLFPHADINIESPKITAFLGNINYRQALTFLAELSSCFVLENRQNTIQFLDIINELFGEITWNYKLDGSWRLGEKPFGTFGRTTHNWNYRLDGSWQLGEKPFVSSFVYGGMNYASIYSNPDSKLSEYYNGINLTEYTISTEIRQLSKTIHNIFGSQSIIIYFDTPQIGMPEIHISDRFILSEIVFKTMYMIATLTGNGEAEIIITGNSVSLVKSQTFYPAPWNTGREPEQPYMINLPMMIRTGEYENFRNWFLERKFIMLFKRLNSDIRWRQNPAQLVGDSVKVQLNKKGNEANMIAIRQELNYTGGILKGTTKLIGEVDF